MIEAASGQEVCRPRVSDGILVCPQPVVRQGRCILHTPKRTALEKQKLAAAERRREEELDAESQRALLCAVSETEQRNVLHNFQAFHFCDVAWNQPPLSQIFRRHVDFSQAVFDQKANFSAVAFARQPRFNGALFRDEASFSGAAFHEGGEFGGARFDAPAVFNLALFSNRMNFANARFVSDVNFNWATVDGRLWFRGASDNACFFGE